MEDLAKKIAEIFDTSDIVESNEDEEIGISESKEDIQSFSQKAKDLQLIVEKESYEVLSEDEPEKKTDKEVIKKAAENAKKKIENPELDKKQTEAIKEVKSDIKEAMHSLDILEEAEQDPLFNKPPSDNPLGLSGKDLEYYNSLIIIYGDRFLLSDETVYMNNFFKFKVRELGYLISKSQLIDCDSLMSEIKNINVNHSIEGFPAGDVILRKINNVMRQKERLSYIMIKLHEQYHLWEVAAEMLRGKLYCVKDIKGQQKREGIAMDYMSDVIHYVSDLKRTMDTGKHVDSMLSSSWDSLSRQLSCIQEIKQRDPVEYYDRLDTQENKPKPKKSEQKIPEFGDSEDDLSNLG